MISASCCACEKDERRAYLQLFDMSEEESTEFEKQFSYLEIKLYERIVNARKPKKERQCKRSSSGSGEEQYKL